MAARFGCIHATVLNISAVESEVPPDGSMLENLYYRLRALGPALFVQINPDTGF